jgi:hypothetical protein
MTVPISPAPIRSTIPAPTTRPAPRMTSPARDTLGATRSACRVTVVTTDPLRTGTARMITTITPTTTAPMISLPEKMCSSRSRVWSA